MKKRILSFILTVCLILSTLPVKAFASNTLYGDANSNGDINMGDVLATKEYIAGYGNSINKTATDVNSDGSIDAKDLLLLKKYIARWDVLLGPPFYSVAFNSNGGSVIESAKLRQGELIGTVPFPKKENGIFLGWYTDKDLTKQFYAEDAILSDLTLYAKYAQTEKKEQFLDNTFTLTEQKSELFFKILSSDTSLNADAVLKSIILENVGNSDYVNLNVTGSNGDFTVTGKGGFIEGASYKLTLENDSLKFEEKAQSYRTCTFTIAKEEVIDIELNNDIIYLKSNQLSNITANGKNVDELSVAILGNTDTNISGSFQYDGAASLKTGDSLCVYENIKPTDRDTTSDYSEDNVAYVQVVEINEKIISFKSADAEDVIAMPDTLPVLESEMEIGTYNDNGSFSAKASSLDFSKYAELGLDGKTTVDKGDYIVITENDKDIVYGRVDSVTTNGGIITVNYTKTTAEKIQNDTLDYYTKSNVDGEVMIENADIPKLEKQIEIQTLQSGFAKSAMNYLASAAVKTNGFKEISGVEDFVMTTTDGSVLDKATTDLLALGIKSEGENITVEAEIDNKTEHFKKGLRIAVRISGEIAINAGEENEVVIELSATFVEEVKMSFNADGGAVWKLWKGFIPYISDYKMNANIDVFNYTGISVAANVSLKEKENDSIDISEELENLIKSEDEEEITAGVQDLFEAYGDMLENDTDYVNIVDKNLVENKAWVDPFCIIAYSYKMDFVVSANINLALGCNFEYMSGTRYNFWFAIKAKSAGNSTMDLMDETYSFQFYAMGHLGLKVGLQFEFAVGLFSTDLASIGLVAEAGAYVELFGYFFYEFDSVRIQGTSNAQSSSKMSGALYLEFGIYIDVSFKAQAGNEKFVYNPTLYEHMWPLLYAGEQINVYDFGYDQPQEEDVVLIKDVTEDTLPESIRYMDCLDLKEGDLSINEYGLNKFYYSLTNKNFALDENTGVIKVTVPEDVRYMECDLTLTWKPAKLAFSKDDVSRTIHLVWTNLTNTELKEKYDVSVKVGDNIVWSTRVNRGETPVIPTQEEILKLIGYDKYVVNGTNLKYTSYKGYGDQVATPATGKQTYNFDVTERKYSLKVDGIENESGAKTSKTFTANFGESFDLSSLGDTGTSIAGKTYTRYFNTTCSSENGREATDSIDTTFATELINNTNTYTAKYVDNSSIVTYLFSTLEDESLKPATEIIKKGTIPVFDYSEYVLNQGEGYIVKEWDKAIGKVSSDTTFTALCIKPTGEKYTITFETKGGSSITPVQRYEGATISAPAETTKTGYTFEGWYLDEELTNKYTFGKMPSNSFKLYAKWTAKEYIITFNKNGGECATDTITVTYDKTYGTLPTPTQIGYAFTGWYTELEGGAKVESTTSVKITAHQILYAHWAEKTSVTGIVTDVQTYTYDTNNKTFVITGSNVEGFKVKYKKAGDMDWSDSAVNAGKYAVMITRDEDETYKPYEKTLTDALIIDKATRSIIAPTTVISTTFTSIGVNVPETNGDGIVEYAVNSYNQVPTSGWSASGLNNLRPSTNYYIFARIVNGVNYLDATSTNSLEATTGYMPTGNWINNYDIAWYNSYSDANKNYTISNAGELAALSKLVNEGKTFYGMTVTLNENLDLSAYIWTPIGRIDTHFFGDHVYPYASFQGTFDGNNKTISGVCISGDDDGVGLFSSIEGGPIKNITLINSFIQGRDYVGGIAAYSQGNIENCNNYSTVIGNKYVGGIVGYAENSYPMNNITNCSNNGRIIGEEIGHNFWNHDVMSIGGIVGYNDGASVSSCYNTSDISGDQQIGGILGYTKGNNVTNCYNTGNITAQAYYVGGIVGENEYNMNITNCYNMGKMVSVNPNPGCAAIAGGQTANEIKYCYNFNGTGSNYTKTEPTIGFNSNMSITSGGSYGGNSTLLNALNAWVKDNPGYTEWIIDENLGYPVFKK